MATAVSTSTTPAAPQAIPTPRPRPHWIPRFFSSTVGGKYLVAVTGLALVGFVIIHLLGNLQIFLGREAYNRYAYGLKSMGPLLWIARGGLLAVFVAHIAVSLRLKKRSLDARPVPYAYERTKKASIPSRFMPHTGVLILLFVLFHLAHFTFGWIDRVRDRSLDQTVNYLDLTWVDPADPLQTPHHDAYWMFIDGFRNVPVAILYIAMMLVLGMHLIHGIRSSFQTLGINSVKVNSAINLAADGLTIAIVLGNIAMPIAVMAGLIGESVPR